MSKIVTDFGPNPFVLNVENAAMQNQNYRTALWTGEHLQMTLMSIEPDGEVGLEVHEDTDQIIFIIDGAGLTAMGETEGCLHFQQPVFGGSVIFVPQGTWHNVVNTGCTELKICTVYGPPHHPFGTIHKTFEDDHMGE